MRLALGEVERLNVAPSYTNIHLMCLFALLAGGQLLADPHFLQLGRERWARWVRLAVQTGAPREYNSTTYMGMDLTVLAKIRQFVDDPAIRLQARLLYERYWLDAALRLHRPTGQLAGPHARCYWGPMMTGQDLLGEILWRETGWTWPLEPGPYGGHPASELPVALELALTEHWLPAFVAPWLERQASALPYEVRETASLTDGYDLTTYLTPAYALGSASRTYSTGTDVLAIELMANSFILHYRRPDQPGGWGLAYSRYVVNDQHWGTLRSFPHRPRTNFYDQGHFAGAQLRNKAIALYALMPLRNDEAFSLKTVVAFQSGQALERLWLDDAPVRYEALPLPLAAGRVAHRRGRRGLHRGVAARAELPRARGADPPGARSAGRGVADDLQLPWSGQAILGVWLAGRRLLARQSPGGLRRRGRRALRLRLRRRLPGRPSPRRGRGQRRRSPSSGR